MRSLNGKLSPSSGLVSALILLFMFTGLASAQTSTSPTQQNVAPATTPTQTPEHKVDGTTAQKAAANEVTPSDEARQAQLVADTDKLFQLAQELQTEVAKTGKDTLSIAVIKKAAEVEKLARSLKERMRSQ
ncbi:MAG TPA: hypothetical protein VHT28_08485 [Silvibacterium sp.]|nr:hypothetical protein [Silvibacterium sp.]